MTSIDRYTCEEVVRRLDDYVDRELAPHEMQLMRDDRSLFRRRDQLFRFQLAAIALFKKLARDGGKERKG